MSCVTLKDPDDYEIFTEHPNQIRKKSNQKVVSEYINGTNKYWSLNLNQKFYSKHRVLAIQFIPNPENLPECDHINRIKTDNRVENLRWSSSSDNQRNRTSRLGIQYDFINELPESYYRLESYGKHSLMQGYYISMVDDQLKIYYQVSQNQYRILHVNRQKYTDFLLYYLMNSKNRKIVASHNILKRHIEQMIDNELNDDHVD